MRPAQIQYPSIGSNLGHDATIVSKVTCVAASLSNSVSTTGGRQIWLAASATRTCSTSEPSAPEKKAIKLLVSAAIN
jgi:hypothetical protein